MSIKIKNRQQKLTRLYSTLSVSRNDLNPSGNAGRVHMSNGAQQFSCAIIYDVQLIHTYLWTGASRAHRRVRAVLMTTRMHACVYIYSYEEGLSHSLPRSPRGCRPPPTICTARSRARNRISKVIAARGYIGAREAAPERKSAQHAAHS